MAEEAKIEMEPEKKKSKASKEHKKALEQNKVLLNQNKELTDKVLRLTAEMQNMKRHFEEDRTKFLKYDGESFIKELLPVIDNFERALLLDDANLEDEVSKFLSGFKMIYAGLNELLETYQVTAIDCIGKEFDPDTMNAVLIDHEQEKEDNIVLDCMQKGYLYKDKLIRPAMVKVNHKESEE